MCSINYLVSTSYWKLYFFVILKTGQPLQFMNRQLFRHNFFFCFTKYHMHLQLVERNWDTRYMCKKAEYRLQFWTDFRDTFKTDASLTKDEMSHCLGNPSPQHRTTDRRVKVLPKPPFNVHLKKYNFFFVGGRNFKKIFRTLFSVQNCYIHV